LATRIAHLLGGLEYAGAIKFYDLARTTLVWVPDRRVAEGQHMRAGDIAICMSSGSQSVVGKTAILRQDWPGSVGAFCAVIRPLPDRVLPDWLAFFLRSEVFRTWTRQSTGANIKNIRKSELEAFPVPVPRMAEQRRIVDILFRAEGIVRLRREAQQKAAELIPANFIDMFGDPGTNPNGWSIVPMGELVGEFRYGTSQKSGPVGVPVLRIPNVVGGAMDLTEVKLVSLATAEHERLRLLNGDLLFVRTNGNPDFVGRCSVYDSKVLSVAGFDGSECVYASYLIRARLSDSRVSPAYLQAYLSSQRGRQLLRERAKTSAGQFNLNIDGLGSLPVPVPPQSLQRKFTESVDRFASVVSQQGSAQAAAGALFRSLLARAFGAGQ
jgi:type I restriction enzyme S subunit